MPESNKVKAFRFNLSLGEDKSKMPKSYKTIETCLVHAGEPHPRISGAVATPIFQSATFEYENQASYHDIR
jgi:hypothetical protein